MKDKILPGVIVVLAVACFSYAAFEVNASVQRDNNIVVMPKMENLSVQRFERSMPLDTRAQDLVNKTWTETMPGSTPEVRTGNWRSEGPLAYNDGNIIYIRKDLLPVLSNGALKEIVAHELAHIYMDRIDLRVGYDKRIATHGDVQFHDAARMFENWMN